MPELVAPIMPDIAGSFRPLARGMAQWAENRRYAQANELGQQKLAQDAASDQQRFELQRQQLANQYSYQQSQLDIARGRLGLDRDKIDALKALGGSVKDQRAQYNMGILNTTKNAVDDYHSLQLDDPEFMLKQPMHYAANFQDWKGRYQDSRAISGLKPIYDKILDTQRQVDQLTVPVRFGATFNEQKKVWQGPQATRVPAWQVVQKLQDPDMADETMNALIAAGQSKQNIENLSVTGKGGGQQQQQVTTTQPSDLVKRYLEEATTGPKLNFQLGRNRVPEMTAPTAGAYQGTGGARGSMQQQLDAIDQGAALPDDQSNLYPAAVPAAATPASTFEPTQTDQILSQARMALQAGAPLQAIAQRLAAQQIDPRLLFQASSDENAPFLRRARLGNVQEILAPGEPWSDTAVASYAPPAGTRPPVPPPAGGIGDQGAPWQIQQYG